MPIVSAAVTPRVLTYITPPEVTSQVQALRDNLYNTASVDKLKLCKELWDPSPRGKQETEEEYQERRDRFWPYGKDVECRARQIKYPTDFRNGIYYTFQHYKQNGRKDLADALVEPLATMIAAETQVYPKDARDIVVAEYFRIFGFYPLYPGAPTSPGVVEPSRQPVQIGPVDMPGIPEEDVFLMDEPVPGDAASVKEFPWAIVGVGALVLVGGGYYLMTRKKR